MRTMTMFSVLMLVILAACSNPVEPTSHPIGAEPLRTSYRTIPPDVRLPVETFPSPSTDTLVHLPKNEPGRGVTTIPDVTLPPGNGHPI